MCYLNNHLISITQCYLLLGVFYYSLGNITPALCSSVQSIRLVAVVKSSNIALYGIDTILEPFMEDLSRLELVYTIIKLY